MTHRCGPAGRLVWAFVLPALLLASGAWGATASIHPQDWQYRDLDALARAGLLVGHPKAPLSTWTDKLTRFEAASLTLRAVQGVGQAYQAQGSRLRELAQAGESALEGTPAAPAAPAETAASTVSAEDLARVQKLIEEFRTELVGMGQKLTDLDNSVQLIMSMTKDIQKQLGEVAANQSQHQLSGYIMERWIRDSATAGKEDFYTKAARLTMQGALSPRSSYRIEGQFDASATGGGPGSKAQLRTATIDYKLVGDQAFVRAGQATLPFGYELEEATPGLWTGDRSVMMDTLFPDQRDLGTFVEYKANPAAPKFDLGLFNGTGINTLDNNKRVNVLARAMVNVPGGSVAASVYDGKNGAGAAQVDQNRFGLGTKLAYGQLQLMGEWITGKNAGETVDGYYAQAGHPIVKGHANLLFAKYDRFNEDTDAANRGFHRWSLGYWYQLDPKTRLTVVHEIRDVGSKFVSDGGTNAWNGNATFLQLEVVY